MCSDPRTSSSRKEVSMADWKVGEVAFQPNQGFVGRVKVVMEPETYPEDVPPENRVKQQVFVFESNDILLSSGCLRGTEKMLQLHERVQYLTKYVVYACAVAAQCSGVPPEAAAAIISGVLSRQAVLLGKG